MKNITYFMFILVACIILGFVSYTSSYSNAFYDSMSMVDDISSFLSRPLKGIFEILGISKSPNSQFTAYFAIRSTLDNELIPKSNQYYDDLMFAVEFPKSNFLCVRFNNKIIQNKEKYTSGIVLYFGTDGAFLFGQTVDGRYSPFKNSDSMTVEQWHRMFKGSYFDVETDTVYIDAPGLGYDAKFQFKADGFQIGIWS